MAARLLGCAAASVTAVGGSAAFLRRPVLADEQPQSAPATPAATKKKLSIYDEPEPATQLVPTPVPLQAEVAVVREHVQSAYRVAHERVYGAVGDWIKFESSVEDEVKSIVPKDEQLNPALIYVGISTLTGSILSRNRNILFRFAFPPLFFAGSMAYFAPKLSSNLLDWASARSETVAIGREHAAAAWGNAQQRAAEVSKQVGVSKD